MTWRVDTDLGTVRVDAHEGAVLVYVAEDHSYAPGMAEVSLTPDDARALASALLDLAGPVP